MGNREDRLKGILKRIHGVKLSNDFTAEVMREIDSMAEEKVYADEKIKTLLKNSASPAPSNAFTYKVLNAIREKTPAEHKPIISKGVWAGIISFVTLCIVMALMSGNGDASPEQLHVMSLGNIFGSHTEIISYLAIALTSGSLLLLLDYFLNKPARLAK